MAGGTTGGGVCLACGLLSNPAPPPMTLPANVPMTAASSSPVVTSLSNAMFCSACSDTDCGSSSKKPSDNAPSAPRRNMPLGFAPASTLVVPLAIMVSMSPIPSFWATLPPAAPNNPVVRPVAPANAACLADSKPSALSWRICSPAEPAPIIPSPIKPEAKAPSFGAAYIKPLETAPPASIAGTDSLTTFASRLGLDSATPALPMIPSAC